MSDSAQQTEIWYFSRAHLALLFGVAERTIYVWEKDRGFPASVAKGGRYDLRHAFKWYRERDKAQKTGSLSEERKARLKKTQEQTKLLELERRQKEGELIEIEEMMQNELAALHELKAGLLEIGPAVAGDDVALEERVTAEVRAALEKLSRTWGKQGDEHDQ